MISAFGIVHKSMVSPGVFKPAKLLGSGERQAIKSNVLHARSDRDMWGPKLPIPQRGAKGNRTLSAKLGYGNKGPKWGQNGTKWMAADHPAAANKTTDGSMHTAGGKATITSNKGTGVVHMFGDKGGTIKGTPASSVLEHEQRHIAPKRNPIRWQERKQDPFRRGREEGRADFGIPRDHPYPGNPEFRRGYEDVQARMTRAKRQT